MEEVGRVSAVLLAAPRAAGALEAEADAETNAVQETSAGLYTALLDEPPVCFTSVSLALSRRVESDRPLVVIVGQIRDRDQSLLGEELDELMLVVRLVDLDSNVGAEYEGKAGARAVDLVWILRT